MRSRILPTLILLLFLAPVAAAGPSATVGTLTSDKSGCERGYSSDSGQQNDTWWFGYHDWSRCDAAYRYAHASVSSDGREVVGASAWADHSNSSSASSSWWNRHTSDDQAWSSNHHYSYAHQESRGVTLTSRAGGATVSDGCEGHWQGSDHSYASWNSDARQRHANSWSDDASACGPRASSDAAGVPADLWVGSRCAGSSQGHSSESASGSWYDEHSWRAGSWSCLLGTNASAEGEGASAGFATACSDTESAYRSGSSDWNSSSSYRDGDCSNGVVITGPDGATFFAGHTNRYHESCYDDACGGWNDERVGFFFQWEHSPHGPNPLGFSVGLP